MAARAGEIALRVLAGEDPSSIPVDIKSNARPMFDYRQLALQYPRKRSARRQHNHKTVPHPFMRTISPWCGGLGVGRGFGSAGHSLGANITRRRQAEQALQKLSSPLHSLFDAIPNPIFYKDKNGVYLGCPTIIKKTGGKQSCFVRKKKVFFSPPKTAAAY